MDAGADGAVVRIEGESETQGPSLHWNRPPGRSCKSAAPVPPGLDAPGGMG